MSTAWQLLYFSVSRPSSDSKSGGNGKSNKQLKQNEDENEKKLYLPPSTHLPVDIRGCLQAI